MKTIFIQTLLTFVAINGLAQSNENDSTQLDRDLSGGGLIMFLAPTGEAYDSSERFYGPQVPWVALGKSWLNKGDKEYYSNLKKSDMDGCLTLLMLSKPLSRYRPNHGVSAGLQLFGTSYSSGECNFDYTGVRIPVLIGAQDNRRNFTVQTGLALYGGGADFKDKDDHPNVKTPFMGVQWMATVGVGPICGIFTQNLTPLFKLKDGPHYYPSSLSVGIDVWYVLSHYIWK